MNQSWILGEYLVLLQLVRFRTSIASNTALMTWGLVSKMLGHTKFSRCTRASSHPSIATPRDRCFTVVHAVYTRKTCTHVIYTPSTYRTSRSTTHTRKRFRQTDGDVEKRVGEPGGRQTGGGRGWRGGGGGVRGGGATRGWSDYCGRYSSRVFATKCVKIHGQGVRYVHAYVCARLVRSKAVKYSEV